MNDSSVGIITFEDVEEMISKGEFENKVPYPTLRALDCNHVFGEDKSVRWNRDEVAIHNNKVKEQKQEYQSGAAEAYSKFHNALMTAIEQYTELPTEKANIIYGKAYNDSNSSEYHDVVHTAYELCDLIVNVMK